MEFDKDIFEGKEAFSILKFLSDEIGPRVTGSSQEDKAAKYILSKFDEYSKNRSSVNTYSHKFYSGKEASVTKLPDGTPIHGKPLWMTKSTPGEGIEGNGFYLGSINQIDEIPLVAVQDKIVFIFFSRDFLEPEIFTDLKKLYRLKPSGVVILSNYNSKATRSDPFIEDQSIFAQIPTMIVPANFFSKHKDHNFSGKYILKIKGMTEDGKLNNVIFKHEGARKETIIVCAHHDTVEYSPGARDNASGIGVLLELASIITKTKNNYSYIFLTIGGEEQGLDGVWKFIENNNLSDVILCLNIDGVESLPGFVASIVAGDEDLFRIVKEISQNNEYPALAINNTPNSGDNMAFAHEGIPSIMHMFKGSTDAGINHTALDTSEGLDEEPLKLLGQYLVKLINRLELMPEVEFSVSIPLKLEEQTINYFKRLELYNEH